MSCDLCRQKIEAYFDGELDPRDAALISAHLSACATCANVLGELEREAEVYKLYERDAQVTPALWAGIEARISGDPTGMLAPQIHSTPNLFALLARAFRFQHIGIAATVLLLLVSLFAFVLFKNRHEYAGEQARVSETGKQVAPSSREVLPPSTQDKREGGGEISNQIFQRNNRLATNLQRRTAKAGAHARSAAYINEVSARRRDAAPPPRRVSGEEARSSASDPVLSDTYGSTVAAMANARRSKGKPADNFEEAWQRHAEQAQLLLRSFRNARSRNGAIDVAYERRQARHLLYQNIFLRRDANGRGRVLTEEMLSRLEPVLLDIANLPARTSPEDVRIVRTHIGESELVATLSVQSNLLARAN